MQTPPPLKLIIFGAGLAAQGTATKLLGDPRLALLGFYDNDERKWGTQILGLPVSAPATKAKCPAECIYIASSFTEAIHQQLKMLGYEGKIASNYDQLLEKLATHEGKDKPTALPPTFDPQLFPKILGLAQNLGHQPPYEETLNKDFDGTIAVSACANNQLPLAKVLARSFLKAHPHARVIICIADLRAKHYTYPDVQDARIEVIESRALNIPAFQKFAFQYNIFELCCAIKAYGLLYAFKKPGVRKLLYLDADGLVLVAFDRIFELLQTHSIILTPHRFTVPDKYYVEHERIIMDTGSFNAGFLAMNTSAEVEKFLHWWAERIYRHCTQDGTGEYFVDQRWLNWVPLLFENVHILREPGINDGMWSAEQYPLRFTDNRFWVSENKPLVFYHFSKVSLTDLSKLFIVWMSPYPPSNELHLLVLLYRTLVLQSYSRPGHETSSIWAYGQFSNGVYISRVVRNLFRNKLFWSRWEDPFDAQSEDTFWNWLNTAIDPNTSLTNLFAYIESGEDDTVFTLPAEEKIARAYNQFMHCVKSGNPYAIDLTFYRQVINNRNQCSYLTAERLQEIPEHFLAQL